MLVKRKINLAFFAQGIENEVILVLIEKIRNS